MSLRLKIAIVALMLFCLEEVAVGQADSLKNQDKFTKNDQILLAAFDDSTEALAALFITKRSKIKPKQVASIIGLGVSVTVLGIGVVIQENNSSSPSTADEEHNFGFIFPLAGACGVLITGAGLGVESIHLRPYTVKRYNNLLGIYKSGKPLPDFYVRKITPLLKRK